MKKRAAKLLVRTCERLQQVEHENRQWREKFGPLKGATT